MKDVLLILFGFFLGNIPVWLARKRRLRAHWCALRAGIIQCNETAKILLKDRVAAPLYRLPLNSYHASFPVLLADGAVSENEILTIGRFFSLAEDINRGLDNADKMSAAADYKLLQQEFNRNCLKAKEMVEAREGSISLSDEVIQLIEFKLSLKWWQKNLFFSKMRKRRYGVF
jgi:hypothetical protein